ncbi:MAG: tetratricopeptide repeat protein [Pseudomonadota bacterium]
MWGVAMLGLCVVLSAGWVYPATAEEMRAEPDKSAENRQAKVETLVSEGRKAFESKEFERAIDSLSDALKLDSESQEALYWRAKSLSRVQREKDALVDYFRLLYLNPKDWRAQNNVGFIYAKLGKFDQALPYFQKAFEINGDPQMLLNAAFAAYRSHNIQLGLRLCRQVAEMDKDGKYGADAEALMQKILAAQRKRNEPPPQAK